jgi:GNAT superfamily N-acetyltransferase
VSLAGPVLRVSTDADLDAIAEVMRASVLGLFPLFYDDRQTASAAVHIAHVDPTLVADGTYFVHDVGGEIVACGGWSRRGRLFMGSGDQEGDDRLLDPGTEAAHIRAMFVHPDWTRRGLGRAILEAGCHAARSEGFQRLDLMAMLPGVALYRSFGFREIEPSVFTMPDGVSIDAIVMDCTIDPL